MQYQLVLQFPEKIISYDDLVKIEEDFTAILKNDEVDGHDVGSGEINYFILTEDPQYSFKSLKQYLVDNELLNCLKSAYRKIDDNKFIILFPSTLKEFKVK